MKLTIFAATGRIGRHLLEQATAGGHDVTVVVRDPTRLSVRVRRVAADLAAPDPARLASAVEGADAVLSGLGPRSMRDVGIASKGTRAILTAMQTTYAHPTLRPADSPLGSALVSGGGACHARSTVRRRPSRRAELVVAGGGDAGEPGLSNSGDDESPDSAGSL
jgi:hypothetical protein